MTKNVALAVVKHAIFDNLKELKIKYSTDIFVKPDLGSRAEGFQGLFFNFICSKGVKMNGEIESFSKLIR